MKEYAKDMINSSNMKKEYKVTARWWEESIIRNCAFGDEGSFYMFTDSEVLQLIIKCGRASITPVNDYFILEFQNDYD